ncbi:MAG: molecular chaperone HtpG [Acutalibacteraceae bacterium]|nr:molecular chaperone HtpG [Bacillota bacterium]
MEKKEFKAESKRLLDMMINSIYTHNEIFLRELISNASDATDKLYYNAMQSGNAGLSREDLAIHVQPDKENRILTISDKGCGMTKDELENNLGTIAKSGSLAFKQEHDLGSDVDIIGQFGVGFYSAFMVAKKIVVVSKSTADDKAYRWESDGADGYTIEEASRDENGTTITLYIKDNTEDENYDEFLETYSLQNLIKKYSDYIRYPITMDMERSRDWEEGEETDGKEYATYIETETINSMVPVWKKTKAELGEKEYEEFYKNKFGDYEDPARCIHQNVEGTTTYTALMFIPARAPFNYYSKDYEKGLQLYSNGVMIMDKCADLLPDYFSFVKGLVDSPDLSLNISREMLQHDRQLKSIAAALEKKIKSELKNMLKNDRDNYEKVFKNFGLQLKFGIYSSYGMKKDLLADLLLYYSSSEKKMVTLDEYVDRMKESQKYIYYACGESTAKLDMLPQTEMLRDKGYEILYLTDDIDEFTLKSMQNYKEKEFRSVSDADLDVEDESEKEEIKKASEDNKDLFDFMKEHLGDSVKEVRLSNRLKSHPVCLTSDGGISLEMEKVLNSMPNNEEKIKASRVLEINANHPIFAALTQAYAEDKDKAAKLTDVLFAQASLIEGIAIDDPVAYANAVCSLISDK